MNYYPFRSIEEIFYGKELDCTSLFHYDFKLINILSGRISQKTIDVLVNEEIDYESFIELDDDDINDLDLTIGPKIALRNIIKKEKNLIKKIVINKSKFKYLKYFDFYYQLIPYKNIFIENNIEYNTFILLTKIHLDKLGIPKGPSLLINKIILDIRYDINNNIYSFI